MVLYFPGCAHLWFTSVMLTCYILLMVIKNNNVRVKGVNKVSFFLIFALLLFVAAKMGVCIEWWFVFLLGYYWAREKTSITVKYYTILTLIFLATVVLLFGTHSVLDGTMLYEQVIVYLANNIITIWCFETIRLLNEKTIIVKKLTDLKLMRIVEKYSYEVYITHYLCMYVCFSVIEIGFFWQFLMFTLLTCVSTVLLHKSSDYIKRNVYDRIYK